MSLQILLNGISTGAVYSLIAIGFALVFNILKFSNFSHGATMTASAFIAYFLVASKGWGLAPTLLCSALSGAIIGLIGEFIGFRRILLNHSGNLCRRPHYSCLYYSKDKHRTADPGGFF